MRRIHLIAFLLCCSYCLKAQNVQLHYDFGHTIYDKELSARPKLTSTVEMFKPDLWGNTFFFVDMDYANEGVELAYWEISRELKFWDAPFLAHFEYNGGVSKDATLSNCFLVGPTFAYNNAKFTKGFTITPMYKYIMHSTFFHGEKNNFQLTGTWYLNFCNGKFSFDGFADWWKEENAFGDFIFMSEPQFWINLNGFKHINNKFNLSFGSEIEITYQFGGRDGWYVIPTLAAKWSF